MTGRKRHLVVDTGGNVLAVAVDTAAMSDAEGGRWVLARARAYWPELAYGWADQAYRGLVGWARTTAAITVEIVARPAEAQGFVLLPRRWVVERTLAWLNRNRRLAKDVEATIESSVTWLYIASVKLMSRRLAAA